MPQVALTVVLSHLQLPPGAMETPVQLEYAVCKVSVNNVVLIPLNALDVPCHLKQDFALFLHMWIIVGQYLWL